MKLKSEKSKAKPRKRIKIKTPIFSTGDCITFKLKSGNYGGAIVISTDLNPETGCNLVASLRIDKTTKPILKDFENAEVLICNYGAWQNRPQICWYFPDLYFKDYSEIYESIGNINVGIQYDPDNHIGKGYLFKPSWTSGWSINESVNSQFDSELSKPKPLKKIKVKELIQKKRWWRK